MAAALPVPVAITCVSMARMRAAVVGDTTPRGWAGGAGGGGGPGVAVPRLVHRGVHQAGRLVHAVVGDDVVGVEHLHGGDRDPVADGNRPDRGAVPVVEVGQLAVLLMGQAEAR